VAKYSPVLLAEFSLPSATYFAQNSAGKLYQGLYTYTPHTARYTIDKIFTKYILYAIRNVRFWYWNQLQHFTTHNEWYSQLKFVQIYGIRIKEFL